MDKVDAWSLYWLSGNQDSCIPVDKGRDGLILSSLWQRFSKKLVSQAQVLDLATGNGTVPVALLSAQDDLNITGVDYAKIDPKKFVSNNALASVSFFPEVDIANLPFSNDSFDAVTSQFGFEYAELRLATEEFVRVLKPRGLFTFVLHSKNSEVVKPAIRKIAEFELIKTTDGLLENISDYISDNISLLALEQKAEQIVAEHSKRLSEAISGQIFTAIGQFIAFKNQGMNNQEVQTIFDSMKKRIFAEGCRLEQLVSVSLSENDIMEFQEHLSSLGVSVSYSKVFLNNDDEHLAWKVTGIKL
ncbi:class I SAM-dependent methyltransferase [Colwelliaceae bacterium 6471]